MVDKTKDPVAEAGSSSGGKFRIEYVEVVKGKQRQVWIVKLG
jgi:hypothetical protein